MEKRGERIPVSSLRPGMEGVTVRVRVIETTPPKTVETRRGLRTISEAVVGDETGRVRLTLWGDKAGSLEPGDAIEIANAWTTSYRGYVVLNAGSRTTIKRIGDDEVVSEENVPEEMVRAPQQRGQGKRRRYQRR